MLQLLSSEGLSASGDVLYEEWDKRGFDYSFGYSIGAAGSVDFQGAEFGIACRTLITIILIDTRDSERGAGTPS